MTPSKIPGPPQRTQLCFEYDHDGAAEIGAATEERHGGWNSTTRTIAPFRDVRSLFDTPSTEWFAVDSICAAYEAGMLKEASEIASLFVTTTDKRALLDYLFLSQGEWVNERHYACFAGLFGVFAEDVAANYRYIGEYLREYVLEDAA